MASDTNQQLTVGLKAPVGEAVLDAIEDWMTSHNASLSQAVATFGPVLSLVEQLNGDLDPEGGYTITLSADLEVPAALRLVRFFITDRDDSIASSTRVICQGPRCSEEKERWSDQIDESRDFIAESTLVRHHLVEALAAFSIARGKVVERPGEYPLGPEGAEARDVLHRQFIGDPAPDEAPEVEDVDGILHFAKGAMTQEELTRLRLAIIEGPLYSAAAAVTGEAEPGPKPLGDLAVIRQALDATFNASRAVASFGWSDIPPDGVPISGDGEVLLHAIRGGLGSSQTQLAELDPGEAPVEEMAVWVRLRRLVASAMGESDAADDEAPAREAA